MKRHRPGKSQTTTKARKWRKWTKAEVWILDETEEDGSVVFDIGKKEALEQIFGGGPSGVCIRDLRLASDAEKLELSAVLWEQGIVHVANGTLH